MKLKPQGLIRSLSFHQKKPNSNVIGEENILFVNRSSAGSSFKSPTVLPSNRTTSRIDPTNIIHEMNNISNNNIGLSNSNFNSSNNVIVLFPSIQLRSNLNLKPMLPLSATKNNKQFILNKCNSNLNYNTNLNKNEKIIFKETKKMKANNVGHSNEFRNGKKTKTVQVKQSNDNNSTILKFFPSQELYPNSHNSNHPIRAKYQLFEESNVKTLNLSKNNHESDNEEEDHLDNEHDGEDQNEDDQLAPKRRIVRKSMGLSQAGIKHDAEKENQDAFIILNNVLGIEDYHIYGVMDGHGANGHLVSAYIKQSVEDYFTKEETYQSPTKKSKISSNASTIFNKLMQNDCAIIKAFYNKISTALIDEKFDVHFSGSTCVLVFQINNKLICSNVGDSRAIIVKDNHQSVCQGKKNSDPYAQFETEYLSQDHKPENSNEKERIEKMGGIVEQSENREGVREGSYRVWMKGEKHPGLAMSRSIGDEIAESIGVIHDPEILVKDITNSIKYIVLASDGVWEFLNNNQVMNIINMFFFKKDIKNACQAIITEATAWWKKEDSGRDDITVVISFLGQHIQFKKCTI